MKHLPEPHKTRHAVVAALIMAAAFGAVLASNIHWGAPPPPAAMRISLIPDIPVPPPPPQAEPEPAPEPQTEQADAAAEAKRQAEVIRAEQEKQRKEEEARKKREQEKKRKDEQARKKREQEKQRKEEEARKKREEEKRRKEEEEQTRQRAEAAAAAAARQEALQKRASRIADRYASLIINRINDYLKTPSSVPLDSDIVVIVRVRVNPDGSLIGLPDVVESSGFPEYDDAAVRAVLKAAPLPIPKEPFITENEELMQQFLEHTLYIRPI